MPAFTSKSGHQNWLGMFGVMAPAASRCSPRSAALIASAYSGDAPGHSFREKRIQLRSPLLYEPSSNHQCAIRAKPRVNWSGEINPVLVLVFVDNSYAQAMEELLRW
jgi:hypothetical protein